MRLLRQLRCLFGGCPGTPVSGWRDDGRLMQGFRCYDCGKVLRIEGSYAGTAIPPERVAAQRALSRELDGEFYWEPPNASPSQNGGA